MPRATLTYDLPEDNAEFRAALAGREALAVLHEIDCKLRNLLKYDCGMIKEEQVQLHQFAVDLMQQIRNMIPGELLDI